MTHLHITKPRLIIIGCAAVLIVAAFLLLPSNKVQAPKTAAKPKNVITHSVATPSEKPITASTYVSTAVDDEPKSISLPSINASGFIQKVGIDQYGQVASPNNVQLAGWYVNSLKPGQAGLSIIDGHVDGKTEPGIFLKLAKLTSGDAFAVDLANGTKLSYQVVSVTSVKVADVPNILFAHDPSIPSQLNIITCYGTFSYQSDQYDQRTIVVSKLISNT
jgi:LPXTG-site transpeptidase (sortase) family protein